ncbi:XylR family transcriptional regulator [Verrucomicrobia bacterium LW23]|nr:XylR family transcriptional regulator [Verrucomicrobia bacterium LW23]
MALIIETSNAYARGLLHGVHAFARERGTWAFSFVEQGRGAAPPAWLAGWHGDGIIARMESPEIALAVQRTGLPAVDVSAGRFAPQYPWVETDDAAIARLAVQHLRERGFRRLAYCGDARFAWSRHRARAFRALVEEAGPEAGLSMAEFVPPSPPQQAPGADDPARSHALLVDWLRALEKPAGVFAGYDVLGRAVLEACRAAGLAVPEDVAVLGMDDDELLCELSTPPLSSIIPDSRRTGYEAASLLEAMMRGECASGAPDAAGGRLIAPLGVHARQSTDVLAVEDPAIARALRFIRKHACDADAPINVGDVLRVVPLSRRVLEKRFSKALGRTPHEEILHTRLARAQRLLRETKLSLEEVAAASGFTYPEYLSVAFKRTLGTTPSAYRRKSTARLPHASG